MFNLRAAASFALCSPATHSECSTLYNATNSKLASQIVKQLKFLFN